MVLFDEHTTLTTNNSPAVRVKLAEIIRDREVDVGPELGLPAGETVIPLHAVAPPDPVPVGGGVILIYRKSSSK